MPGQKNKLAVAEAARIIAASSTIQLYFETFSIQRRRSCSLVPYCKAKINSELSAALVVVVVVAVTHTTHKAVSFARNAIQLRRRRLSAALPLQIHLRKNECKGEWKKKFPVSHCLLLVEGSFWGKGAKILKRLLFALISSAASIEVNTRRAE